MAYPTSLDSIATGKTDDTTSATDHPAHHNSLATAINSIETELGTLPKGASADVKTRLNGVDASLALLAPKASPAFTGTPTVPTAVLGTNTTQAASTAYVQTELAALVTLAPATAVRNTIQATADVVTLTVKGRAAQSTNLFEVQNSASSLLFAIQPDGGSRLRAGIWHTDSDTRQRFFFITDSYSAWRGGAPAGGGTSHEWRDGADTSLMAIIGGLLKFVPAASWQTTVGAAGAASALPATPTKYLKVVDNAGTTLVIPAYAAV